MTSLSIILSGAFTEAEIRAEFGSLPPAFLPLGGRRLVSYQAQAIPLDSSRRILTLPESFSLTIGDEALLAELELEVLRVPDGLSLGEAIVHVLVLSGIGAHSVRLLHGDTLLPNIDYTAVDVVSIARTAVPYILGAVRCEEGRVVGIDQENALAQEERDVLSGYFHIGDAASLAAEIVRVRGDFIAGLNAYARRHELRAVRSEPWFDFGHVTTFYSSRRRITTERAFNNLFIDERKVTKGGADHQKIEAEARWFENLPSDLRIYTPHYLGRAELNGQPGYKLEYVYRPSLSDLYVFGRLSLSAWAGILTACDEALTAFRGHRPAADVPAADLYLGKTLQRLETYARSAEIDLDAPLRLNGKAAPSILDIAHQTAALIPEDEPSTFTHGDFCFSNLLYDARGRRLISLDPRGFDSNREITPWGDPRYDVAKLYHSAIGLYDHILAGHFRLTLHDTTHFDLEFHTDRRISGVQAIFSEMRFAGRTPSEMAAGAIAVHLFLSMVPLHHDRPDRQRAFLANAVRLFLSQVSR